MTVQHYAKVFALFTSLCTIYASAMVSDEQCCRNECCVTDGKYTCIPFGKFCSLGKPFREGEKCGAGGEGRTCMDPDIDRTKVPNGGDCTAKHQGPRVATNGAASELKGDDSLCQSGCCFQRKCVECEEKEEGTFWFSVVTIGLIVTVVSIMVYSKFCSSGVKSSPEVAQTSYQRMDMVPPPNYHPPVVVQQQQLPTIYIQQ